MEEYEIAMIAHALSHPMRVRIYKLLEKNKEMKMGEIYQNVKDDFEFTSRQTVFGHVRSMETDKIVETSKIERGEIKVKLKKRIKIEFEDLPVD